MDTGTVESNGRLATVADLLAIPERERFHEIIGGQLIRKANPTFEHGDAQGEIYAQLKPYKGQPKPGKPGGWWFATEVEIKFEESEVYRPDVVGWRHDRVPERPTGTPVQIRPDWTCEVLSPSNPSNDLVEKLRAYHRFHVPHYWIVDPIRETLSIYRWHPDAYLQVLSAKRGERVEPEPFSAIHLQVGVLFGDEEE